MPLGLPRRQGESTGTSTSMKHLRSQITPELVTHYDRPGPRYTSYPTAPKLREDFDALQYVRGLCDGSADRPLSLYFHLPFCKSLCYYCGCHMLVTYRPSKIEQYLAYLVRGMNLVTGLLRPERVVRFVHWGGGTPTYLRPEQVTSLMSHIRDQFTLHELAEISIEADPRTLTVQHVAAARAAGFNRISLGVQDLDEQVQNAIGRIQSEAVVRDSVEMCRSAGFDSISADLIYGLPHQTEATFHETLRRVLALDPDRLSLFSYAHVPWIKKHQRAIPSDCLPSPPEKLNLLLLSIETLTEAGFRYVGMDHFAREDDPLCRAQDEGRLHRNFQGYATDAGCDLLGFGISSISQLDRIYVQNEKGLSDYYRRLGFGELPVFRGVSLTDDDVIRRRVITRLMCDFVVDRAEIENTFGIDFNAHFAGAIDGLAEPARHALVTDDGRHIRVTELGRLFVRNIAMLFDAYLKPQAPKETPTYSQTI